MHKRTQLDTLILIFGVLFVALTGELGSRLYDFLAVEPPSAIRIQMPSEANIKEQVRQELRAKQYKRAARIAAAVYKSNGCKATYADLTGRFAVEFGINPRILAALVFVESTCRATAVSGRDSVGLTQVNPRVWKYSRKALLDPETNMKIGASILAGYTHKYGLVEGLHHYNGLGDQTNGYAMRVFQAAGMETP
jgi:soluble lytic murein transglycosylase-like protein